MGTTLIGVMALRQPQKVAFRFPGVFLGRVSAKPLQGMPVRPFLRLLLLLASLSFRERGLALILLGDVFRDHVDARLDG